MYKIYNEISVLLSPVLYSFSLKLNSLLLLNLQDTILPRTFAQVAPSANTYRAHFLISFNLYSNDILPIKSTLLKIITLPCHSTLSLVKHSLFSPMVCIYFWLFYIFYLLMVFSVLHINSARMRIL